MLGSGNCSLNSPTRCVLASLALQLATAPFMRCCVFPCPCAAVAVLRQAIFDEFNTLSVVYQQPAALFVQAAQYQLHEDDLEQPQVREWQVANSLAAAAGRRVQCQWVRQPASAVWML